MKVELLYSDGCPHWTRADAQLRQALLDLGHDDIEVEHRLVTTQEEAEQLDFLGSPTIRVDGHDPFAPAGAAPGLSCRLYRSADGVSGAPTVEQLHEVLRG